MLSQDSNHTTNDTTNTPLYPTLTNTNEDKNVSTEEPNKGTYTNIYQDELFKLSVSSVNYCGKEAHENIFEFYSNDLDNNSDFHRASKLFSTITYKELKTLVKNTNLQSILNHIVLTEMDTHMSIVDLVKEEKIHWGEDNNAPNRQNAIITSSIRQKAPTQEDVNEWYTTGIQEFTEALESEALKYTGGNVNLVISGLLVYDLLCNHVYNTYNLASVRSERVRLTDSDELDYQTNKFNNIIQPLLSSDIVAVQEAINFNLVKKYWFKCFKSNLLPKDKVVIEGVMNSDIRLIVNRNLKDHITLLTTPETTMDKYIKKTSFFSVTQKGKKVLLCVLHMKNPKKEALNVAKELNRMIDVLKIKTRFDYEIVIGDTNIEAKNDITPHQFASKLGMTKVANSDNTTSNKRTILQAQVKKAYTEAQEEKDMCFHSRTLVCKNFSIFPNEHVVTEYIYGNLYPNIIKSYYPTPEWQSEHRAISVTLEGSREIVF